MKPLAWSLLASVLFFTATSRADDKKDEKKDDPIKVVVEQLDKAYGIKFKSVKVIESSKSLQANITVTLEFTKDVSDLAEIKKSLTTYMEGMLPKGATADSVPLVFHVFDKDNVSLEKLLIWAVEGDLTGVKGDAFRVTVVCYPNTLKNGVKLEARLKAAPTKPEKVKD